MTTWTTQTKSGAVESDFLFSDGLDFLFSDGTDYVFKEGASWMSSTKSNPSWSSGVKSSVGEVDFLFSDGLDFLFSDDSDYLFREGTAYSWSEMTKSFNSGWLEINKQTTTWTSPYNQIGPAEATIVQSAVSSDVSSTTYTATFSTPPTAGNTIIMIAAHSDGPQSFNAPTSPLQQIVLSNASIELDIGIWYTDADPLVSSYSITKTGSNNTGIVVLLEVAGLNTSDPIDVYVSNNQTSTNSRTATTGTTAETEQYGFAIAGISFADNDFTVPTSANWTSGSTNSYTQHSWTAYAAGNDLSLGIATANINRKSTQSATLTVTGGGSTEQRNSVLVVFKR